MYPRVPHGALRSNYPQRSMAAVVAFLEAPLVIVSFDDEAARHHAEIGLALRSQPIGERVLVIAATARARSYIVRTGRRKHSERVPGLAGEDWVMTAVAAG